MTASQPPNTAEELRGAGLRVTAARVALLETVRDGDHLGVDGECLPLRGCKRDRRRGTVAGAHYGVASKQQLKDDYAGTDFGMVLRDDHVVNRVSCPTKLFDYLCHGVVPIVRSPLLGDFEEYGYSYVTETEFSEGFFPDCVTRRWMVDNNHEVLRKFIAAFRRGVDEIRAAALE